MNEDYKTMSKEELIEDFIAWIKKLNELVELEERKYRCNIY